MFWRKFVLLTFICICFTSCEINLDRILGFSEEEQISIIRYDRLQNEYILFDSFTALQQMNTRYVRQTQILMEEILNLGQVSDPDINEKLHAFYSDTTLLALMKDVENKFLDIKELQEDLNKGFRQLKEEVPSIRIPEVYIQVSALNESIVVGDSLLGISLDKYMGTEYPLYERYYYPYQRKTMNPERILPDSFLFYLIAYYPLPDNSKRTLLDIILHRGKINYVVQQILDYRSVGSVIGYSKEEEEWCKKNLEGIWSFVINSGHLYDTDPMLLRTYLRPVPSTPFFGEKSPGLIGVWLGTTIISSYMKNHKKVTLNELLNMSNYSEILVESRFNP